MRAFAFIPLALMFAACTNNDGTQVIPPVVVGMLGTMAPTYDDGETQMYQVSSPVTLPMRRPNQGEIPSGTVDPYPRNPFLLASDTQVTVRFTLSNLDNVKHSIELLVDPWNEFVYYVPGVVVGDEETTPNFSGIDRFFVLEPLARVQGIITPDDMQELAIDLDTAMMIQKKPPADTSQFAGPALYNRDFDPQNRSTLPDPLLDPYRPKVVAGVTGFDLGLRTYEQAKIAVEIVIDVEDMNGDRVIKQGDTGKPIGKPGTMLSPPAPPVATGD
jgi:hypothetical protein